MTRGIGLLIPLCFLLLGARLYGFDAVGDFSTNANPNGVWSYGWATAVGNPFQLLGTTVAIESGADAGWWNGMSLPDSCVVDKDFVNAFSSGSVVYDPDTLHTDPESYAVMVRFTAPSNGAWQVSGLFRIQDTGTHAHDLTIIVNTNATNFQVFTSGGGFDSEYAFDFSTNLTTGGTVDFIVSCPNGDFYNLGTGLKATVTPAVGTTYTWTGAASSDWFNATNWTPQGTPGPLDTAVITGGNPTVGTATNVGFVTLGGNATLNATAGLTVSNQFNWDAGSLTGQLIISSNATLNLNAPGGYLYMYSATIVNNGTAVWEGGSLYCNGSTEVTNNGLWLAQTDDYFYDPYGGSPVFYNNGVFTKGPSTGTTYFYNVPFDNSGTVNVNSGTLNLDGGGVMGGTFLATGDTTLDVSDGGYLNGNYLAGSNSEVLISGGAFTYGPSVNFSGPGPNLMTGGSITLTNTTITNLAIDGGTITLTPSFQNGSITNLTMVNATLIGTNTVTGAFNFNGTINGALTVVAGASCYITNLSLNGTLNVATNATLNFVTANSKSFYSSTVVNNGTVAWDGGTLYCNSASTITNNGAWLAETDDYLYNPYGGSAEFYNNGIFTKSPTTGTTYFYGMPLNNTGTVNVETGTINVESGGLFEGDFLVGSSATLIFSGGGFLDGTATAATNGEVVLSGGAFTYGPGLSFTGPGVNILNGGSLVLTNNVIPNLAMTGGTVTLGPSFQGGTITNLTLSGVTLAGSNYLTGTMHWQAGTLSGIFTVASNAILYLDGDTVVSQYAALTNAGQIIWNGSGDWRLINDTGIDGSIDNLTNATIDIECNQSLYPYYGGQYGWLNNEGLVRKSLSSAATSISATFTNIGTVELLTGTIDFGYGAFGGQFEAANGTAFNLENGGVLTGSFTAGVQAVVDLTGGTFTQAASLSLGGAGTYEMTGGTLTLLNNTIPNLQLEGGTILTSPGFQGGSITNLVLNGLSINTSNLITGSLTVYGNINAPLVVASNATLTWNGWLSAPLTVEPGATLNWSGGYLGVPLYIPTNAVLNLTGNVQLREWLANAGTINWTGGNPQIIWDYGISNLAGATFNVECDQTFSDYYGGEFFSNAGLFRKWMTSGGTTFDLEMDNTGVVDVEDGSVNFQNYSTNSTSGVYECSSDAGMYFSGGGILTGAYTVASGGFMDMSGGTFTITPPLLFNGAGTYEMTGGTLTVTNSLIPNLQLLGGTINCPPGFQGGSITNLTLNGVSIGSSNLVTG
ncbi:MAG: hypothetical protein ABSG59_01520, partial [Verrucomicrobiota bacterium]